MSASRTTTREGFVLSGKENSCESPIAFTPSRCADLNCVSCLVGERACCAEVPVGGSIVWTNKAFTNHTATSEDDGKAFDTGEIKPGESSSPVEFDKQGEFQYHCKIHGKTMSGVVVVKPAGAN